MTTARLRTRVWSSAPRPGRALPCTLSASADARVGLCPTPRGGERKPFFVKKGFSLSPRPLSLSKKTLVAAALSGIVSAQHIKTADSKVTSLLFLCMFLIPVKTNRDSYGCRACPAAVQLRKLAPLGRVKRGSAGHGAWGRAPHARKRRTAARVGGKERYYAMPAVMIAIL